MAYEFPCHAYHKTNVLICQFRLGSSVYFNSGTNGPLITTEYTESIEKGKKKVSDMKISIFM